MAKMRKTPVGGGGKINLPLNPQPIPQGNLPDNIKEILISKAKHNKKITLHDRFGKEITFYPAFLVDADIFDNKRGTIIETEITGRIIVKETPEEIQEMIGDTNEDASI